MSLQSAVDAGQQCRPRAGHADRASRDLDAFWDEFGYSGRHDRTQAELDAVRALRPRLRELLTSDRDDAVEMVNAMLARGQAVPQLVRHDPFDWHIHAVALDAPLADRIIVETAMAMVDVIRADEMSRLGICADDTLRGHRPRPVPQPVPPVLLDHLRQPQRRRRLPGPPAPVG